MTSATLAVGEDFSHFTSRLGLSGARCLTFPSPFDLAHNGLVYLPRQLPAPSDRDHTAAVLEALLPVMELTDGGVFCLFTSHRALNNARYWFRQNRSGLGRRPLLVQGTAPRDDLTRRFREAGNAVLLGTGSFWEGIDVRGEALTVVMIDKLPFASPGDPLTMARLEFIRREGGNGFMQHQVPQAVLALKQGVGRLLRSESDYGVILLGDPRLTSKGYGKLFLDSLAPMPTTPELGAVRQFFMYKKRAVA
jgi:ATP-dependent DNA helicase DinG